MVEKKQKDGNQNLKGNVILNVCEFSFGLKYVVARNIAVSGGDNSYYGWAWGLVLFIKNERLGDGN